MGIAKGALSLLFQLKTTEMLQGTVCQLGRQTSYVSEEQVGAIADKFGFPCVVPIDKPADIANDEFLFRSLGFDVVESIDCNDYEQASHILDLNNEVPCEYYECFDVIYDGGTLEHLFNIPQALKSIFKMLKPGGLIIHGTLPVNNWVDHGFVQFSPTLFHDYYSANKWEIIRSYIFELPEDHANQPWKIYKYDPGNISLLSSGNNKLGIWFVAKKHAESKGGVVPMQGSYIKAWDMDESISETNLNKRISTFMRLKILLKSNKITKLVFYKPYLVYVLFFGSTKEKKLKPFAEY